MLLLFRSNTPPCPPPPIPPFFSLLLLSLFLLFTAFFVSSDKTRRDLETLKCLVQVDVSRIRSLIIIISSSSITIAIIIILVSHPVCCRLFLSFFLDLTGIRFSVVYGYTFSCFSRAYTFLPFTGILQTLNNGWRCPWILTSCHATGSPDDDQICHK